MSSKVLIFLGNDPWGEPRGGQTNFAKQMLYAFSNRLAVASSSEASLPLRTWCDRPFEGKNIKFFNIGNIVHKQSKKPIIPYRYTVYRYAKISMSRIYELGLRNLFISSPEILFAAANYKWESVCYRFAGVNNPVANSRYRWARLLGQLFEKKLFYSLKKINVSVLLASADQNEIDQMVMRSGGLINKSLLYRFPTRVDVNKFRPISRDKAKKMLDLKNDKLTIVTCGRLSWVKGWDLLLDAAYNLKNRGVNFQLIFVGDGEDREKVEKKALSLGIAESIQITGFVPNERVAIYLNAADICVVGSHREGWSLAMLEILACGKPLVSTNVSGADEMIIPGKNGFIVKERDPIVFADSILESSKIKSAKKTSLAIASRYSTKTLAHDLAAIWQPLSGSDSIN